VGGAGGAGEGRPRCARTPPPPPPPAVAASASLAADGLVAGEGAAGDRRHGRRAGAGGRGAVCEATTEAGAGEGAARVADAADGLVARERAVADGEGGRQIVNPPAEAGTDQDDAAPARVAVASQGQVVV